MFGFLKKLFPQLNKPKAVEEPLPMKKFLIVGLGNIGAEYANTRHNIGFKIVDYFGNKEALTFQTQRLGDVSRFSIKGRTFIFLKPSTYMNLSGKAVKYWMTSEKIPLENLLVITDDINLPFGSIRIKTKGSDGGHNGLKSIQAELGTDAYNRFRFGIGDAFAKGRQVNYVLGEWTEEESAKLPERLETACNAILSFGLSGIANTMNNFNGK